MCVCVGGDSGQSVYKMFPAKRVGACFYTKCCTTVCACSCPEIDSGGFWQLANYHSTSIDLNEIQEESLESAILQSWTPLCRILVITAPYLL